MNPTGYGTETEVGGALCTRWKTCRCEVRTSAPRYGVRQRHTRTCYQHLRPASGSADCGRKPPTENMYKRIDFVVEGSVAQRGPVTDGTAQRIQRYPAGRARGGTCRDKGCNWVGPAGQKCVELRHAKCLRARFWVRKTPTQNYTAGLAAPVGRGQKPHGDKARPPKEG